jgi:hypothetical protein
VDSTKIQRRTELHKGLEEDWTSQKFRGDWTPQRCGGGLDSIKVRRSTGLHKGLEEDWTQQRFKGGLDSTKIWRRAGAGSLVHFPYFTSGPTTSAWPCGFSVYFSFVLIQYFPFPLFNHKPRTPVGKKPSDAILNFFKLRILLFFCCFLKTVT